jgi:hypothetical protein
VLLPESVLPIRGFNVLSDEVDHIGLPLLLAAGVVAAASLVAIGRLADLEAEDRDG